MYIYSNISTKYIKILNINTSTWNGNNWFSGKHKALFYNAHVPETNTFRSVYVSIPSTSQGKIWAARAAVAVHSLALDHERL